MVKKILFILLSLLAVVSISAVSAESYMVKIDGLSDDVINQTLQSITWKYYTPQYNFIGNGIITFPTEKDYIRFILPYDGGNAFAFPPEIVEIPYGYVVTFRGSASRSASCIIEFEDYTMPSTIAIGGYTPGGGSGIYDDSGNRLSGNTYAYNLRPLNTIVIKVWDNGVGPSWTKGAIFSKAPVKNITNNGISASIVQYKRIKYPLTIKTAPGAEVYVDGVKEGTTDENGVFTTFKEPGTYTVKVVISGISSIEKTVDVQSDINNTVSFDYGTVNIKVVDGLSGESLAGVSVSGDLTTTIDGTFTTNMPYGEYTLIFHKGGYWNDTRTITVDGDKNITIELFPTKSILKISQTPEDIETYPSSMFEVVLNLEPIQDAYSTKLYITGVDVIKIQKNGINIPESNDGSYIIGDLKEPTNVKIVFATPDSTGGHQFIVRFICSDILGNEYVTQKTITYQVQDLPFIVQQPPSWSIGDNEVSIIEQSGDDYSVLLMLKNANGSVIWSKSGALSAYDTQTFTIPITAPGNYVLEISAKNGEVTTYVPITVVEPIKLLTPEVEAGKGQVATVELEIKNPTNEVKYYDAIITGSIFSNNSETPKTTFSIAPGETKTVELKFEVPDDLEYDSYEISVQVFEKDSSKPIFTDKVVLKIVESSFLPIGGGEDIPTWALAVGILLIGGIGAYFIMKR
ncbi:PEGA domain-containing protein [Methanotorris igneus]|uniref:PEGA domain-containing protein n=1 Tax=Methanotorris igneus (strain DSM 5666 / JCM 11834 / Kol 5) TaxID=880724 RepID=F6BBP2_METIK|nr:PEGA domain-containing protein [Methanotorris igneus]AEF96051.1 hypothetical protein Metig_0495 [Methanotorris igneus Kol 5]